MSIFEIAWGVWQFSSRSGICFHPYPWHKVSSWPFQIAYWHASGPYTMGWIITTKGQFPSFVLFKYNRISLLSISCSDFLLILLYLTSFLVKQTLGTDLSRYNIIILLREMKMSLNTLEISVQFMSLYMIVKVSSVSKKLRLLQTEKNQNTLESISMAVDLI